VRKIQDPRVKGVHIVSVDVSPDFHLARVYFSMLDDKQDPEKVQKGLDSAKAFLRRELKKVIQLRHVPELAFSFDPSIRHGDHMLNLLKKLQNDD
jgi:ribosome-binding factor A